eukprot:g2146.t1
MEVRWRLFARDVLSLLADDAGGFRFGRPPRPVRGLRLLGVVVHREWGETFATDRRREEAAKAEGAMGNGEKGGRETGVDDDSSGDGSLVEGGFGLLGVDDGTGVVEVRLPLRLWEAVALSDQVDIVGTPERARSPASTSSGPPAARSSRPTTGVRVKGDGCYVERDPNVAILRALECINLYKACYFSRAWSPSAVPLPALLPDPQVNGKAGARSFVGANGNGSASADAGEAAGVVAGAAPRRSGGGAESAPSVEGLLGLIGSMGGATAEQLAANLGLPPGHQGVASALDQMQLDGAIYQAGDRYMPL